jgi:energy-coupling factor transport system ATP-binding protein
LAFIKLHEGVQCPFVVFWFLENFFLFVMIEVKELRIVFEKPIFDQVSFTINKGEFCVLVGANGSGKSTLLKAFVGLVPIQEGFILLNGLNPGNPKELPLILKQTGFLFQNPEDQIVAPLVEEEVAFGLSNLMLPLDEMEKRIEEALHAVNLEAHRFRLTQELSGGEKQRLAIASLLAMNPSIFLLDEPTSLLDFPSRNALQTILKKLHESGKTILMATQELDEVFWGNRILLLHDGKITSFENSLALFSAAEILQKAHLDIPYLVRLEWLLEDWRKKLEKGISK